MGLSEKIKVGEKIPVLLEKIEDRTKHTEWVIPQNAVQPLCNVKAQRV